MKRILITIAVIMICFAATTQAKDYNTAIGLRGGFDYGLTIKHFISNEAAIEGLVSSRWKGTMITGLYELHAQAFNVNKLNWYYGIGGHIGFWSGKDNSWFEDDGDYTVIGIDAIIGLEYTIKDIPFCISVDWKPVMNLSGYSGFWGEEGAFSVRYTF